MKTQILILATIASLAALNCRDLGTDPPIEFFQDDIKEAVFRYQFSNNYSGQQQTAKVYFIGVYVQGDSTHQGYYVDPSDEFMKRFRNTSPPVKKASQCDVSPGGAIDKQTGDRGLLFRIGSIRVLNYNEVEVEGGYFEGALSASGNVYTVRRIDNRCVVIKDVLLWIA